VRALGLLTLAVLALGGLVVEFVAGGPAGLAVLDLAAGWALLGAAAAGVGLAAGCRGLLGLAGAAWFLGTAAADWGSLYSAPLIAALLAAPAAWPHLTIDRAVVAAAGVRGLLPALAASEAGTLVTGLAVAALGLARRRWAAATFGAALAGAAGIRVAGGGADPATAVASVAVVASCALLVGSRRPLTRGGVSRLIVDLGQLRDARSLERRLADALGDPGLELRYRLSVRGTWLDAAGRPVRAPDPAATLVETDSGFAAALVHDADALADLRLKEAVLQAVRLAVLRLSRTAEAVALGDELADSRRRLVTAAARELDRFAGEVEAGPGALLSEARVALDDAAGLAPAELETLLVAARAELDGTRTEMLAAVGSDFGGRLAARGLDRALTALAHRAGASADVQLGSLDVSAEVAAAAWFCASEGLANALKHAGAVPITLSARVAGTMLILAVIDDGPGGADPVGGGLVHLRERVQALGGSLSVDSPPRGGTRVLVSLPASSTDGRT
jgi:signal transduction histidine kinase